MRAYAHQGLQLLSDPSTASQFFDMNISSSILALASHTVEAEDAVVWAFIRALTQRAINILDTFGSQVMPVPVARGLLRVGRRLLHVSHRLLPVARCLLPVACHMMDRSPCCTFREQHWPCYQYGKRWVAKCAADDC